MDDRRESGRTRRGCSLSCTWNVRILQQAILSHPDFVAGPIQPGCNNSCPANHALMQQAVTSRCAISCSLRESPVSFTSAACFATALFHLSLHCISPAAG